MYTSKQCTDLARRDSEPYTHQDSGSITRIRDYTSENWGRRAGEIHESILFISKKRIDSCYLSKFYYSPFILHVCVYVLKTIYSNYITFSNISYNRRIKKKLLYPSFQFRLLFLSLPPNSCLLFYAQSPTPRTFSFSQSLYILVHLAVSPGGLYSLFTLFSHITLPVPSETSGHIPSEDDNLSNYSVRTPSCFFMLFIIFQFFNSFFPLILTLSIFNSNLTSLLLYFTNPVYFYSILVT